MTNEVKRQREDTAEEKKMTLALPFEKLTDGPVAFGVRIERHS